MMNKPAQFVAGNLLSAVFVALTIVMVIIFGMLVVYQLLRGVMQVAVGLVWMPLTLGFYFFVDSWFRNAVGMVLGGIANMAMISFVLSQIVNTIETLVKEAKTTELVFGAAPVNKIATIALAMVAVMALTMLSNAAFNFGSQIFGTPTGGDKLRGGGGAKGGGGGGQPTGNMGDDKTPVPAVPAKSMPGASVSPISMGPAMPGGGGGAAVASSGVGKAAGVALAGVATGGVGAVAAGGATAASAGGGAAASAGGGAAAAGGGTTASAVGGASSAPISLSGSADAKWGLNPSATDARSPSNPVPPVSRGSASTVSVGQANSGGAGAKWGLNPSAFTSQSGGGKIAGGGRWGFEPSRFTSAPGGGNAAMNVAKNNGGSKALRFAGHATNAALAPVRFWMNNMSHGMGDRLRLTPKRPTQGSKVNK